MRTYVHSVPQLAVKGHGFLTIHVHDRNRTCSHLLRSRGDSEPTLMFDMVLLLSSRKHRPKTYTCRALARCLIGPGALYQNCSWYRFSASFLRHTGI
jgi:hypothetical protein